MMYGIVSMVDDARMPEWMQLFYIYLIKHGLSITNFMSELDSIALAYEIDDEDWLKAKSILEKYKI